MQSDEQIEFWIATMKGIAKDPDLSKKQKESDLDDLEEQIKDRLDDLKLKFEDEYVTDVMGKLVDLGVWIACQINLCVRIWNRYNIQIY